MADGTITFRAELLRGGKSATGIAVPDDVLARLGAGRRPRVVVRLREHEFGITLGSVDGVPMIPVSAKVREAAGVSAGDQLDVTVRVDTAPPTVEAPEELRTALAGHPQAQAFYDGLPPSHRKAYAEWVGEAKKAETRQSRAARAVEMLAEGRRQR